jgi:hypothetical protein
MLREAFLTINAPLIFKMRDIIFFLRANYIMGHFKGYFEGAKTFLTPKLSRAQRGTILRALWKMDMNLLGAVCRATGTKKIIQQLCWRKEILGTDIFNAM